MTLSTRCGDAGRRCRSVVFWGETSGGPVRTADPTRAGLGRGVAVPSAIGRGRSSAARLEPDLADLRQADFARTDLAAGGGWAPCDRRTPCAQGWG